VCIWNKTALSLKGCNSNFEVKCSNFKLLQMKQLPCIEQYVLGYCLKTKLTMSNNLTDMMFNDNFYLDPHT